MAKDNISSIPDTDGSWPEDARDAMIAVDNIRKRYLSGVADLEWPEKLTMPVEADIVRDHFRGCLIWGAVGDALGRPVEGRWPETIRERYGPDGLQHYQKWRGWKSGPIGTITDDTQLTMELAHSLVETGGQLNPDNFSRRLKAWLGNARGEGHATRTAVENLLAGQPWWEAGQHVESSGGGSAGNGAAMRAAPIGLVHAFDPTPAALLSDAVFSAVPTHAHPVGVAGAAIIAAGTALLLRWVLADRRELVATDFLNFLGAIADGIAPDAVPERKPNPEPVRFGDRLREISTFLTWSDPRRVFECTYNGAFALESVPAALYCFLRSPNDPRTVILTAVNAGHDADSVASMAGNLAGAWNGVGMLRSVAPEWWEELEYRDELCGLADGLVNLSTGR